MKMATHPDASSALRSAQREVMLDFWNRICYTVRGGDQLAPLKPEAALDFDVLLKEWLGVRDQPPIRFKQQKMCPAQ